MKKAGMLVVLLLLLAVASFAQDGTVVVYRQSAEVGWALKPSIYVDGNQAARLGNGRYISLQLAPGKHNFESSQKKVGAVEVDVRPKETVYLEMVILTGAWHGGGRLIPVAEADAKTALLRLKPSDGQQAMVVTAPEPQPADNSQAEPQPASGTQAQAATVTVKSTPVGADINVDGKFMGNTPSTIPLPPGDHMISVEKEGLRPWQREMTVSAGGSINIDATLEKP